MTVAVHHHLPGRTRLRLASWPHAADLARIQTAARRAGFEFAAASADTSRILVRHAPEIAPERVRGLFADWLAGAEPCNLPAAADDLGADESDDAEAVLARLGSSSEGLAPDEAERRLAAGAPNAMPAPQPRCAAEMLRAQVMTFPVGLLAGSAVLSLVTGGLVDAVVTLAVVAVNAGIGFRSEDASERLIRKLSRPIDHDAIVVRGGTPARLPARVVVPGDLIVLQPGEVVAADARVIAAHGLSVDESALTGESLPVEKFAAPQPSAASVADRRNLVHGGTVVTGGDGRAVVLRTGTATEMARTRLMVGAARPPRPPIEVRLEALGRRLVFACLGASGLVFAIGLLRRQPLLVMAKEAIALAVSAIPEALPAVATTALARAAAGLEARGVYVRALPAVEALGTIDTICLDKTGTLTINHMAVVAAHAGGALAERGEDGAWERSEALAALAEAVVHCNEARLAGGTGSATERALLHFAQSQGLDPDALQAALPPRAVRNRDAAHLWMASAHDGADGGFVAVKGAPAEVLAMASQAWVGGAAVPLDAAARAAILAANDALAARGLRVLGAARGTGALGDGELSGLLWLGLVGLADPVRPEARDAIAVMHRAGVRTIMLTGDQPLTARAVGESLALSRSGVIDALEGHRLAAMNLAELGAVATRTSVFARVSPGDKLRIVEALQAAGRRVAMIGDGVNDGPALRAAAVGIAMGKQGTDVAREIADIVISDDDLGALAHAIAHGRATDDKVRRVIRYFLSSNLSDVLVLLTEAIIGSELESPMELFWLNLATDVLPAIGLTIAPTRGDLLARPPRAADAPLFARGELPGIAVEGAGIAAAALAAHVIARAANGPGPATRGATFLALGLGQVAQGWVMRDRGAPDPARTLEKSLLASTGLLLLPYLLSPLGRLLGVSAAAPASLALAVGLSVSWFGIAEARRSSVETAS